MYISIISYSTHQFSNCSMNRSKPLHFSEFEETRQKIIWMFHTLWNQTGIYECFNFEVAKQCTKNTHGMLRTPNNHRFHFSHNEKGPSYAMYCIYLLATINIKNFFSCMHNKDMISLFLFGMYMNSTKPNFCAFLFSLSPMFFSLY